jgi:hypothetical protein
VCPTAGMDFVRAPDPTLPNVPVFPDCPSSGPGVQPNTLATFGGNQVPIDSLSLPLLPMFPDPTPGFGNFFVASPTQATNWREELLRADHNINSKWHATFRYIHDSWNSITPNPLWTNGGSYPTIQNAFIQPSTSMVARLTTVASPTLLNEFVASYSVNHISFQNLGAWQRPAGYNIGLFQNGFGGGKLPGVQLNGGVFNGVAQDAGYVPNGPLNSNPIYTFRDNVSKIIGRHNLQFGGAFIASQKNELPQFEPSVNGFLTFDTSSVVSTGNAFADLLAGDIASFAQGSDQPKYYLRHKIFEPYFQDDWRITDRLTLNLGLRISMFGTSRDAKKQAFNFDPAAFVPGASFINPDGSVGGNPFNGIVQCGVNHIPIGCYPGHLFNPAPRVGFAWDPHGDGKTAIRGGYGIFFEYTNAFEENRSHASAVESDGIAHQLLDGMQSFALDFVSAHDVHRLRRQANVAGDGDFGVDDAADHVGTLFSAFDLDGFGSAFLDKAGGIAHGLVDSQVVGAVGHVGDQECVLHSPARGSGVVQHLIDRDRKRVFISEHGLGERVADEDHVDAGFVNQTRAGIIVRSQTGDWFVMKLFVLQGSNGNFVARLANRSETHDVLQCPSAVADRACHILDTNEAIVVAKS